MKGRPWLFALLLASPLWARDMESLKLEHETRLQRSLGDLARARESLRARLVPLDRSVRDLKAEEFSWKEKLSQLQSVQDSKVVGLDDLREEVEDAERELDHLENALVREAISEERSSLAAYDPRGEALRELDLAIETGEVPSSRSLSAQLDALAEMAEEIELWMKAPVLTARVLNPQGEWVEGQLVDLGPEQLFWNDGSVGRLTVAGDGRPQISLHGQKGLAPWVRGESSLLPLDVTGGDALAVEGIQESHIDHVRKGGVWVWPIVIFAGLSGLAALIKMFSLYRISISSPVVGHDLAPLLHGNQREEALQRVSSEGAVSREMWTAAIERGGGRSRWVEEVMTEVMLGVQPRFERFLGFIAVTAAIAPLLGLLGTVTGIIKTFQMMEVFGAGDPKPLIGGISEALITTELGLVLAIPALLLHAMLSRRAQSLMAKMERASIALVNGMARREEEASP